MENDNSSTSDISSSITEYSLLIVVELISIISILLIFIYVLFNWRQAFHRSLHTHGSLLIILTSFIYVTLDLPFTISSYRLGYDIYRTLNFCKWWYWIDYSLVAMSLLITATASVQRFVLIFKHNIFRTRRNRYLLHYFPLLFSVLYPQVFYAIVIFFNQCEYQEDNGFYCQSPCYSLNLVLINIDWTVHSIVPLLVIIISHAILFTWILVFVRTMTRQQQEIWKKQKKSTLQLLAFSILFVMGWAPSTTVSVLEAFFSVHFDYSIPGITYLYYISYFICPLQPLLCLLIFPEPIRFIRNQLQHCWLRLRVIRIVPIERSRWSTSFS